MRRTLSSHARLDMPSSKNDDWDSDDDALESAIEAEVAIEHQFDKLSLRGKGPGRRANAKSARKATIPRTASFDDVSTAWRVPSETSHVSGTAARLQRNIEELEHKIESAMVAMSLSDSDRRALQRRASKMRQSQRAAARDGRSERISSDAVAGDHLLAVSDQPALPPPDSERPLSITDAEQAPSSAAAGLVIVASTMLSSPSTSTSPGSSALASPSHTEALPTALQLAGVSRGLWHQLATCEWKRRGTSAVRVQSLLRGHSARLAAAELAATRAALTSSFLEEHPQWVRTPSADDRQALVLPRVCRQDLSPCPSRARTRARTQVPLWC